MNLPNYFLADLPLDAEITAVMVSEACRTIKRNREQYLATRSTKSLISRLSDVAKEWLDPTYPFRKLALKLGPAETGFSAETLSSGLNAFFEAIDSESLEALIEQDLGHIHRLDQLVSSPLEEKTNRGAIASGPELIAHFMAGSLPNPALAAMVLGILTRSAQFMKCASGGSLLPRLFAHSLHEVDAKLAACLEVAHWRGEAKPELTQTLIDEADCITATGTDETLATIRQQVPIQKRFLGYGHRLGFAFVASGVLNGLNAKKVISRAAKDVIAWNQLGCLSPHVIYVEHGGKISAEQFAEMLAAELQSAEQTEPRGDLPVQTSAALASRRSIYQLRAAHSKQVQEAPATRYSEEVHEMPVTRLWHSENSTAWTVVYESEPRFQSSCLHRFIYVKGVTDLRQALQSADAIRNQVSTVGLAVTEDKLEEIVTALARWGVTRVCPLGQMQNPSWTWRHDGRPALGELIRWTDWEM